MGYKYNTIHVHTYIAKAKWYMFHVFVCYMGRQKDYCLIAHLLLYVWNYHVLFLQEYGTTGLVDDGKLHNTYSTLHSYVT